VGDDDGTRATIWRSRPIITARAGGFTNLTYAVDSREDVLRGADICLENGIYIETGPHKHAIQQTFFLYVYEPGGNRVEVDCAARGSSSRQIGSRSSGRKPNGRRARRGA